MIQDLHDPANPSLHTDLIPRHQLFAELAAEIDAAQSLPAPEPAKPSKSASRSAPPTAQGIPAQMREQTRQQLKSVAKEIAQDIFRITPQSINTLRSLDLPPDTIEAVLSINYLFKPRFNFNVNHRLEALQTMPPSTDSQPPDWETWWLQNMHQYIGIRPYEQELQDRHMEVLDQAIYAMAKEAAKHTPPVKDTAFHTASYAQDRRKKKTPTLMDAWQNLNLLHDLGERLFLTPQDLAPLTYTNPEQVQEALEREGVVLQRDAATFNNIQELREHTAEIPLGNMEILAQAKLWLHSKHPTGYNIGPSRHATGLFPPLETKFSPLPDGARMPAEAETELILLTTPFHPALTDGLMNHHWPQAAKAAWLEATTPNQALDYLSHQTDDPTPPPGLTTCPMTGVCASQCAKVQRENQLPFPLTPDGSHHSCTYMAFLSTHKNSPPEIREVAAKQTIKAVLQQRENTMAKATHEQWSLASNPVKAAMQKPTLQPLQPAML